MFSYWEKTQFFDYDFVVIGSGIVGLSTAIAIKERRPNASVAILERGLLPTGASTKNAGFACIGSLTELLDDLKTMSESEMISLMEKRRDGLALLRKRLGDENIEYLEEGSYELLSEEHVKALDHFDQINDLLRDSFGQDVFYRADEKIAEFDFNAGYVKAIIGNHFEGQINTGLMMKSLIRLAGEKGIMIFNQCEVQSFEENNNKVSIQAIYGVASKEVHFKANQLAICTNAFTKQLLPDVKLAPGRGQVIVTKPIEGLKFKGVFHYDEGYFYFRNHGNRVIFGGGRKHFKEEEESTKFEINTKIIELLNKHLQTIILPNTPFEVEDQWTGIMGFGEDKRPILKTISPHIFSGVRLGGMGVAIGSILGTDLADMILKA